MRMFLVLLLLGSFTLALPEPAPAQIRKVNMKKVARQTRRAERQARRVNRRDPVAKEYANSHLDMSSYNMTPREEGRKLNKTDDGRDNYQFNKKGEPMVAPATVLTRKRLKKK